MTSVYFAKTIEKILEKLDYSKLGNNVAIKVHFGEKGCVTYMDPKLVRKVYRKIESLGKKATLVECNVLYKGSRTNRINHLATAKEHGFTGMEIDILDGEKGDEAVEVGGCKIGKGIEKYDSMVVISHFKGHRFAGFGGALKNVGMGFGSRAGKLDMHSKVKPKILASCAGCGLCAAHCNAGAILVENGQVTIDEKKCEGCAMCIAVCPRSAIEIPWGGRTSDELQKRIAEYSAAVLSRFPNAIFINVLEKITKLCDCMGVEQEPMIPDAGILASADIVAVDRASLDLVNKISLGKFEAINQANNDIQIEEAKKLGLGSGEYELVDLSKE